MTLLQSSPTDTLDVRSPRREPDASGLVSADLVRNLDEPDLWAIQTVWENVGSYRRAYNGYEAKMVLVTLMSEAIDEPSAYDRPDAVGDNIPRGE